MNRSRTQTDPRPLGFSQASRGASAAPTLIVDTLVGVGIRD